MTMAVQVPEDTEAKIEAVEALQWFAAYTTSCREKSVVEHCHVRGIDCFLATYRSTRRWKNGCTVNLERPLFPGYVFVRVNHKHRVQVLEVPGVVSIVGAARQPTPLPDADIEALRNGIHLLKAEPHGYLKVGDKARIRNGPLAGMTGILVRKKNTLRVVLTIELIMKSISVEVDAQDLEFPERQFLPWGNETYFREFHGSCEKGKVLETPFH
jgi:transcription antitermination factor NusG